MEGKKLQPAYLRQRYLLSFLRQLDCGASATDIQKLIFLDMQRTASQQYEFIPYKYGPYSFQLAEDLDILRRDSFIVLHESKYIATGIAQLCYIELPCERGDKLLKKVYEQYPYYAINSEILKRLFSAQEISQFNAEKDKLHKKEQKLFTIGYEGRTLEAFVNSLIQNDVRLLCDVRYNPISRKYGFSKTKLQHVLEAIGIHYVHIPEVGITSDKRTTLNSYDDYEKLFSAYEKNLHCIRIYLDRIADILEKYQRIALMCYEHDPQFCHRHIIRDYLVSNYNMLCEDL